MNATSAAMTVPTAVSSPAMVRGIGLPSLQYAVQPRPVTEDALWVVRHTPIWVSNTTEHRTSSGALRAGPKASGRAGGAIQKSTGDRGDESKRWAI